LSQTPSVLYQAALARTARCGALHAQRRLPQAASRRGYLSILIHSVFVCFSEFGCAHAFTLVHMDLQKRMMQRQLQAQQLQRMLLKMTRQMRQIWTIGMCCFENCLRGSVLYPHSCSACTVTATPVLRTGFMIVRFHLWLPVSPTLCNALLETLRHVMRGVPALKPGSNIFLRTITLLPNSDQRRIRNTLTRVTA
jgi:hypothetical protein